MAVNKFNKTVLLQEMNGGDWEFFSSPPRP
jgi:hypothetical protein